jgi:hypothetical protein
MLFQSLDQTGASQIWSNSDHATVAEVAKQGPLTEPLKSNMATASLGNLDCSCCAAISEQGTAVPGVAGRHSSLAAHQCS